MQKAVPDRRAYQSFRHRSLTMSEPERIKPRSRKALLWVIPVSILGIALSVELTRVYYNSWRDVEFDAMCSISERVDCISVALSPYSQIIGLPNSVFGIAFHSAAILLVALQLFMKRRVFRHSRNYLFILAAAGSAYSIYLALVSSFALRTFCIWCTALYLVNIILFFLALFSLDGAREFAGQFVEDGRALVQDGPVFAVLMAGTAAIIVALVYQSWRLDVAMQKKLELSLGDRKFDLELAGDPAMGPATAPITIVEFTDYECPNCARLHFVLKQVRHKYGPRVRVIYKSFPIYKDCNAYLGISAHPHACEAAYATECAHKFGVFEQYVDKLFGGSSLQWDELVNMARGLGLSPSEFENCMKSDEVWEAVQVDVRDASFIKLKGVPTFFVNGYKFDGYRSAREMGLIIDAFLHGMQPER